MLSTIQQKRRDTIALSKVIKKSQRYKYNIQDINKRTWIAVPGKFSLAFSLAVNSYKKIYGEIDTSRLGTNNTFSDSSNIPKQSHTRIAEEL